MNSRIQKATSTPISTNTSEKDLTRPKHGGYWKQRDENTEQIPEIH